MQTVLSNVFVFIIPPIQVLIAFVLVAAAVASPIADKPAADKSESVKDKRAIYGESLRHHLQLSL